MLRIHVGDIRAAEVFSVYIELDDQRTVGIGGQVRVRDFRIGHKVADNVLNINGDILWPPGHRFMKEKR